MVARVPLTLIFLGRPRPGCQLGGLFTTLGRLLRIEEWSEHVQSQLEHVV